ncbi:MAG: SRPBCC family protein, partial [Candidatus Dormibacteraceae bacterium]
ILLGMARLQFKAEVTAKCSPERAFDYFADYRHVAGVLDGVSKWQPAGAKTRGIGARYNVEMMVVGLPLKSVLRLDRWKRPSEIGWVSESGPIRQQGGFTFKKVPSGVNIELRIAYEPVGSFLGAAIARSVDWMVRQRIQGALERIREELERSID